MEAKSGPELAGIFVVLISGLKISPFKHAESLTAWSTVILHYPYPKTLKDRGKAMVHILISKHELDRLIVGLKKRLKELI